MEFFEIARIVEAAFFTDVYKRYLWAYLVIGALCFAILYIFQAIALFTIAKREGFKNKWFAFIPFLNTYYIGVVSEKNKVFRAQTKYVAMGAAAAEAVYVALGIVYYVAMFLIFNGGYAAPEYSTSVYGGATIEYVTGYNAVNLPAELDWAWWVLSYMQNYILYWVQLVYLVLNVFLLVSFFRTYSSPRYVLFSILGVLFPIKAIFMFAVKNNKGKNYAEYLREQQQRQYRMYQEYMRNGQNGYNNAGGNFGAPYGDPYAQQRRDNPPADPFGGLGQNSESKGGGSGDPFDDLKS